MSCGFQPLYGGGGDLSLSPPAKIKIDSSDSPAAQKLRQRLNNFFGDDGDKKGIAYRLALEVKIRKEGFLIGRFRDVARERLIAHARFTLSDDKARRKLLSDSVSAVLAYNREGANHFSRLIAKRDAERRILDEVAMLIRQRLIAFLRQRDEDQTL